MGTRVKIGESKPLNWSVYTNFRSRNSVKSLSKLCSGLTHEERKDVFRTADDSGLYPIHWAAINNRSDMITFMIDNGSPLSLRCMNRFLANGTALHLAAMNGCIEAAAVLLNIYQDRIRSSQNTAVKEPVINTYYNHDKWLNQRDSEGQTPLMRCAIPRSKRMDTVRDLLRKNLWSLNARPSEMALFLISQGADWRQIDTQNGFNLLHLSIVNDHEDLVDLLLMINQQLALIPITQPSSKNASRETVDKSLSTSPESSENESLIKREEMAAKVLEAGIKPLQLAILYGRLRIVERLWYSGAQEESGRGNSEEELVKVLSRIFWSNNHELYRYSRAVVLRLFLIFNLIFLVIVWLPTYLRIDTSTSAVSVGLYLLMCLCTSALAFRVSFSDPGYLNRDLPEYYAQLQHMVDRPKSSKISEELVKPEEQVRLLCHKCRCIRVPRSRHCSHCERCIEDFDHHCIYLGSCIGRRNRLEFLILLIAFALTAMFGILMMVSNLSSDQLNQTYHFLCLLYISSICLYGATSAFFMLKRACQGVSMFEEIRSKRIRDIFGPAGTPHDINKSHRIFSTSQDSFWRYTPNRFISGDLLFPAIVQNLKEFSSYTSLEHWFISLVSSYSSRTHKLPKQGEKSLNIV